MKCFYHLERESTGECASCGKPLCSECLEKAGESAMCARCIVSARKPHTSNTAAGVLSCVIPGLGQLFRGEFIKAVTLFILTIFSFSLGHVLLGFLIWIAGAWDGFSVIATEEELGLRGGSKSWMIGALLIFFGVLMMPGPLKQMIRPDLLVPVILIIYGAILVSKEWRGGAIDGKRSEEVNSQNEVSS